MRDTIIHFCAKYVATYGCDNYIINKFCESMMSVPYFAYSTHCIEAIVCSITAENIVAR